MGPNVQSAKGLDLPNLAWMSKIGTEFGCPFAHSNLYLWLLCSDHDFWCMDLLSEHRLHQKLTHWQILLGSFLLFSTVLQAALIVRNTCHRMSCETLPCRGTVHWHLGWQWATAAAATAHLSHWLCLATRSHWPKPLRVQECSWTPATRAKSTLMPQCHSESGDWLAAPDSDSEPGPVVQLLPWGCSLPVSTHRLAWVSSS